MSEQVLKHYQEGDESITLYLNEDTLMYRIFHDGSGITVFDKEVPDYQTAISLFLAEIVQWEACYWSKSPNIDGNYEVPFEQAQEDMRDAYLYHRAC